MSRWPTAFAIFDSFWRAVAYCLHPRVVLWSLLPLALAGAAVGMLGWAYWESTVGAVRSALERTELVVTMLDWLDQMGANRLRSVMAPMVGCRRSLRRPRLPPPPQRLTRPPHWCVTRGCWTSWR